MTKDDFFSEVKDTLLDQFYPLACNGCQQLLVENEILLCTYCLLDLPFTHWHLVKENPLEKKLLGRIPLKKGTSFLHFSKNSITQQIIHQIKYQGQFELARILGRMHAIELKKTNWDAHIDLIIPLPLHPKKLAKRGYNQSFHYAKGLSEKFNIPVNTNLLSRVKHGETQTLKNRIERMLNIDEAFQCPKFKVSNVLLVDDVATSGATLEQAALAILKDNPFSRINIATLAAGN